MPIEIRKPTTYTVSVNSGGPTSVYLPANAYDIPASGNDSTTSATLTTQATYDQPGTQLTTIFGPFQVAGNSYTNLVVKIRAQGDAAWSGSGSAYGAVSVLIAGSSAGYLVTGAWVNGVYTLTIPAGTNLTQLYVVVDLTTSYDEDNFQDCQMNATVWDIWTEGTYSGVVHDPILDHTAPGTGAGKIVYPSNQFVASSGGLLAPTTVVPSVFLLDGTNGYYFYTGST